MLDPVKLQQYSRISGTAKRIRFFAGETFPTEVNRVCCRCEQSRGRQRLLKSVKLFASTNHTKVKSLSVLNQLGNKCVSEWDWSEFTVGV